MKPESAPNPPAIRKNAHKGTAAMIRKTYMRYPELNHSEIARRVGCVPQNVDDVLGRFLGNKKIEELRGFQTNKADIYDIKQLQLLESVTADKISKMQARDAIVGAAILEDKARLVRGQATGINVQVLMDVAELIRSKRSESE
jgi:hypothetical protein